MTPQTEPRAYVVPASPANGYGTIRSLAEMGVQVIALDHHECPVRKSRYCDFKWVPDPDRDALGFVRAIQDLAASESVPPLVIATQDLHVHVLHEYAPVLRSLIRFPYMSPPGLQASIDKRYMLQQAKAAGLQIPKTWAPGNLAELERILPRLDRYPYIVKPVAKFEPLTQGGYRNFAFCKRFGTKALRAETPERLRIVFTEASNCGFTLLVQEEIPGPATKLIAVDFYADSDHNLVACHTGQKIRQWPADFGTCTLGQSSPIPRIAELAQRFVKRTGFHGIGNIEFKLHQDIPYFLEINPRPWMWIHMATRAGVNLPYISYQDLNQHPLNLKVTQDKEGQWVDLRMDVHHLKLLSPAVWARPLLSVRNDARFSVRDPLPVIDAVARAMLRRMSPIGNLNRGDLQTVASGDTGIETGIAP